MTAVAQPRILIRYIYTFFVGLFLAIFIGMGVAVFYPQPTAPASLPYYGEQLTPQEKETVTKFDTEQRAFEQKLWHYNRNASIIVLTCAVIIVALALLLADRLGVIADGLLLGGIFTLLYGLGRGMATDSSKYRFAIATIGLMVTLVLGYIKFARHKLAGEPEKGLTS